MKRDTGDTGKRILSLIHEDKRKGMLCYITWEIRAITQFIMEEDG